MDATKERKIPSHDMNRTPILRSSSRAPKQRKNCLWDTTIRGIIKVAKDLCGGVIQSKDRQRQATSKRPSMNSVHLFNHYFRVSYFPASCEGLNLTFLPKPGKVPKFTQNLRVISFFSTTGRLFDKFVLMTDETPVKTVPTLQETFCVFTWFLASARK